MTDREMIVFTDAASGPGFLALHGRDSGKTIEVPNDQADQIQQAMENWDTLTQD